MEKLFLFLAFCGTNREIGSVNAFSVNILMYLYSQTSKSNLCDHCMNLTVHTKKRNEMKEQMIAVSAAVASDLGLILQLTPEYLSSHLN